MAMRCITAGSLENTPEPKYRPSPTKTDSPSPNAKLICISNSFVLITVFKKRLRRTFGIVLELLL